MDTVLQAKIDALLGEVTRLGEPECHEVFKYIAVQACALAEITLFYDVDEEIIPTLFRS